MATPESALSPSCLDEEVTFHDDIIAKTVEFVKQRMATNDASHDWLHIHRVWRLARRLAVEEGLKNLWIVELAALLHDVDDWKYAANPTDLSAPQMQGSGNSKQPIARAFLEESLSKTSEAGKVDLICRIIEGVGFKNELGKIETEGIAQSTPLSLELACVQDADRLDAIGAVGIARCLTYGGAKHRPLYDEGWAFKPPALLSKEEYVRGEGATMDHFSEKLLHLKDMIKTASGRAIAQERHQLMLDFVKRFEQEVAGLA